MLSWHYLLIQKLFQPVIHDISLEKEAFKGKKKRNGNLTSFGKVDISLKIINWSFPEFMTFKWSREAIETKCLKKWDGAGPKRAQTRPETKKNTKNDNVFQITSIFNNKSLLKWLKWSSWFYVHNIESTH